MQFSIEIELGGGERGGGGLGGGLGGRQGQRINAEAQE